MERVEYDLQERKIKELKRIADALEKLANSFGDNGKKREPISDIAKDQRVSIRARNLINKYNFYYPEHKYTDQIDLDKLRVVRGVGLKAFTELKDRIENGSK